jgi:hypothetical protein
MDVRDPAVRMAVFDAEVRVPVAGPGRSQSLLSFGPEHMFARLGRSGITALSLDRLEALRASEAFGGEHSERGHVIRELIDEILAHHAAHQSELPTDPCHASHPSASSRRRRRDGRQLLRLGHRPSEPRSQRPRRKSWGPSRSTRRVTRSWPFSSKRQRPCARSSGHAPATGPRTATSLPSSSSSSNRDARTTETCRIAAESDTPCPPSADRAGPAACAPAGR